MTSQSPYRAPRRESPAKLQPGDVVDVTLSPSGQTHRRKYRVFAHMTVLSVDGDTVTASGKGVGSARFTWGPNPWSCSLVDFGYQGRSLDGRYMFWFHSRPVDAAATP
jgi:hypothetical protein